MITGKQVKEFLFPQKANWLNIFKWIFTVGFIALDCVALIILARDSNNSNASIVAMFVAILGFLYVLTLYFDLGKQK